ncbi:hypothetical protein [Carboxylicivirga sp. M1479]|uniref:hypothetical protein n=1 Tax=Carboxylicivirga sp. M1479 TaxID=2594476 RepID=UPI0011777068|nr:hypothetical protein [Carboxylicivirga sp. M1479]TRX63277.1 hypothetical protein FNN09_18680 [Carboxylicivirga sp. M1479]
MSSKRILAYTSLFLIVIYSGIGVYLRTVGSDSVFIHKFFNVLYIALQLLGIAFLIMTTKLKENHKRKLVWLGDLLIIAGAGVLVMHLPTILAYALISVGLIMILIDQLIRLKITKNDLLVERLKIVWYIFFWTSVIFKGLHLAGARNLLFISVIVLWIAITRHVFKNGIPKY